MAEAQNSVVINRPADEVFRFLADGEKAPQWRSGIVEIAKVSGDGVGTTYRQRVRGPGGRSVAADYRITEYQPSTRFAFEAIAGPVRPRGSYDLQPENGGTRVRFALEAQLSGLKKLFMERPVQKSMDAEVASLDRLKSVLENEGSVKTE